MTEHHKKNEEDVEVAYDADFDTSQSSRSNFVGAAPMQSQQVVSINMTPKKLFFLGLITGLLIVGLPTFAVVLTKVSLAKNSGGSANTIGSAAGNGANQPSQAQQAPSPSQAPAYAAAPGKVKPVSKDDHIYGNPNADVTLIEYSDTECPYCKRFHATPKQIVDASKGKVNWVYRNFPLSNIHQNAIKEAEATECVAQIGGNDKYWKYINTIMEKTTSGGTGFALDNLTPLAKEVGVDEKKFKDCYDGGKMAQKVQQDFQDGQAAGIDGTPGNILLRKDGKNLLVAGALSVGELQDEIGKLVSQK